MSDERDYRQSVVIADVHMPFMSMVVFMVKWAIAAIPAMIILMFFGFVIASFLGVMAGFHGVRI